MIFDEMQEHIDDFFESLPNTYMNLKPVGSDESTKQSEFEIDTDGLADWAVRKINEERAELERLEAIANQQIKEIESRVESLRERTRRRTSFLTIKLQRYFNTVPHKETATQEKYELLSGNLVMKKAKQSLVNDDNDKLVAHLEAAGLTEFVKIEKKPAWGEFKKRLVIVDGEVVDKESGEVVNCIKIDDVPESFEVK